MSLSSRSVSLKTLLIAGVSAVAGGLVTVLFSRAAEGSAEPVSTVTLLLFTAVIVLVSTAATLCFATISSSRRTAEALARLESSQASVADQRSFEAFCENLPEMVEVAVERALAGRMFLQDELSFDETPEALSAEPEKEAVCVEERPAAEPALPVEEPAAAQPPETPAAVSAEEAERKYSEFKDIVLFGVANYPGVVPRKMGEGMYGSEGDELVDGSFELNDQRLAVCTFCCRPSVIDRFLGKNGDSFAGFLRSMVRELRRESFSHVFLVFDDVLSNANPYARALNELHRQVPADLFARLELFEGSPERVIPELTERVCHLMQMEPDVDETAELPELSFRMSSNQAAG